jgi:CxxC motif-containing protein (DUF1111 family)
MSSRLIPLFAATLFAASFTSKIQAQQPPIGAPSAPAAAALSSDPPAPAPTGFNNKTNGLVDQPKFNEAREAFEDVETILPQKQSDGSVTKGGLGPVYNATSCVSCHQNPVTGSSSQISEIRAGSLKDPKNLKSDFVEPPGGSLIHQRAIDPQIQERVRDVDTVRTLRMSTNTLGNGFVEVIPDEEIIKTCKMQTKEMRGLPILVPVAVKPVVGQPTKFEHVFRLGRFGWKNQEASLLNFSAGAYLNEMGITSPLQPTENTSNGQDVSLFDPTPDPEDKGSAKSPFGEDVEKFARFMRSTGVPPARDESSGDLLEAGEKVFERLNCSACHRKEYVTPLVGTDIKPSWPSGAQGSDLNGGKVPKDLANKIIRPFSDFLLHDIDTGDGIVQTQHAQFPPRGAEDLLQRFQQTSELQQLQQALADSADCEVYVPKIISSQAQGKPENLGPEQRQGRVLDQRTANMIRTAPLWGLRVRPQLMHDGRSLTVTDAILRHGNQAKGPRDEFKKLVDAPDSNVQAKVDLRTLLIFLNSL